MLYSHKNFFSGISKYSQFKISITHLAISAEFHGSTKDTFPLTTSGNDATQETTNFCQSAQVSAAANQNHSANDGTTTQSLPRI
jgi:hypothetical protein